jgi:transposase
MTVHLVNPSHLSFGVGVITPRWLFVLGAATPASYGSPLITDETLEPFDVGTVQPGAETMGRPSVPPGTYFRLLLIGYFEGIDSERGIAWRATDSLALRDFLGVGLDQAPPDPSTISRTRRLIALETHRAIFTWVLQCLSTAGLVKGKTIGIDATTLEANAALRSIVRRDSGESYEEFPTTLAKASGIGTPTRADLARIDRKRKKKGSNDDWTHPHDPDAKITKMKDGRTHLAHKAEHAIDLEAGAIVGGNGARCR